jgi:hypothetical protein
MQAVIPELNVQGVANMKGVEPIFGVKGDTGPNVKRVEPVFRGQGDTGPAAQKIGSTPWRAERQSPQECADPGRPARPGAVPVRHMVFLPVVPAPCGRPAPLAGPGVPS